MDSTTAPYDNDLVSLLENFGIAENYIDFNGLSIEIPMSDRLAIMALMGTDVRDSKKGIDAEKIASAKRQVQLDSWSRLLPPVWIVSKPGAHEEYTDEVGIPVIFQAADIADAFEWKLHCEHGECYQGRVNPSHLPVLDESCVNGQQASKRQLCLGNLRLRDLPEGYHQFSLTRMNDLTTGQTVWQMPLIVAPSSCHEPDWASAGKRLWGYSVQLYSLRSRRNAGIGDFGDLQRLLCLASAQGADYLILNPLHATHPASPQNCSPYSPSDRRRLNPLYLDIDEEPEYLACQLDLPASEQQRIDAESRRLAAAELVDYVCVTALKYGIYASMFRTFLEQHANKNSGRWQVFQSFLQAQGEPLAQYARWQAAHPVNIVDDCAGDPRIYCYLQWLVEQQLERCQQLAVRQGMRIGLIRDLAVGSDSAGAEVALNPESFCRLVSIGAPPDPLAPQGQNWGLPPMQPGQLKAQAYRHFIELLRTNMAHCGALRIDHVMSLMRLWWSPAQEHHGHGAYVHYSASDLFALLRLESQRHCCVVIGEDLGVVPPEIRHYLDGGRVLSNILFYFEKYNGVHFRRPEHYAAKALCMVANHDVPTLAAWWNGSDLRLRRELGLIADDAGLQAQLQERTAEREQVCHWLEAQWLLPASRFDEGVHDPFDRDLCLAIIRCCARSQSQLLSIQLEDVALVETPVNIPGTSAEYPNWRRKLPLSVWEYMTGDVASELSAGIMRERGNDH